jgi:hypothetical protein
MRRFVLAGAAALALIPAVLAPVLAPAAARADGPLSFSASPNPVGVGQTVTFSVSITGMVPARLEVLVSARGFDRPTMGTLPAGSWTYTCCPAEIGGPAWSYKSFTTVSPGLYRFRAVAWAAGLHAAAAHLGPYRASVLIRVL